MWGFFVTICFVIMWHCVWFFTFCFYVNHQNKDKRRENEDYTYLRFSQVKGLFLYIGLHSSMYIWIMYSLQFCIAIKVLLASVWLWNNYLRVLKHLTQYRAVEDWRLRPTPPHCHVVRWESRDETGWKSGPQLSVLLGFCKNVLKNNLKWLVLWSQYYQ